MSLLPVIVIGMMPLFYVMQLSIDAELERRETRAAAEATVATLEREIRKGN